MPPAGSAPPGRPRAAAVATRAQRIGLAAGLGAGRAAGLWLFSPILTPFVLAAVSPISSTRPAARLNRIGVPRGLPALLLVLALVALALLALLLLYPLLIAQVTVLLQRLPSYVLGIGRRCGMRWWRCPNGSARRSSMQRLQDLAVGQAGAIISYSAPRWRG